MFGIDGAAYRKKEIQARLIDPDYLRALQLEHGLDAWTKGMAKFAGPTTRSCVSQALTRLLAAYEMCGSVYGAAVVATRFTRLFILGPNRVAMEILSDGRMLAGNIPKPLPWTRKDQNEAKMSYAEKATPAPAVSPAVEFKRRVLSETRPLPARLSGICKPSRVVSQPPPRSDHSGLLDCGISTPGGIPPPHVLQSPRSKVSWYKALLLGGRGDVQAPLSPHPSDQSPRSSLTSSATLTPNIEKRLPTLPPPPPDPVCVLPPDSRPGIPFHRMFGQDLLNRLPWSFVVSSNTLPGKEGQAQTTVDMDAVHAFSNLLTAALIRVGQVPYECGTRRTGPLPPGPLPTTNYYPRAEAVAALAETTRIPLELAERIVDNSIVVDEQPHVRAWRQNNWKIPDTVDSLSSIRALDKDFKRNSRWQTSHTPDIVAMERALQDTVTFVPVSRGEMEALIGRQVRADRRQYFRTFPTSAWPAYWDS